MEEHHFDVSAQDFFKPLVQVWFNFLAVTWSKERGMLLELNLSILCLRLEKWLLYCDVVFSQSQSVFYPSTLGLQQRFKTALASLRSISRVRPGAAQPKHYSSISRDTSGVSEPAFTPLCSH